MQRDGERTVAEHSQDVGEFVATLAELKHDGCSLLVVGDVGTSARCAQSRALLGSVDEPRHRVLGVTPDAGDADAYLPPTPEGTPPTADDAERHVVRATGVARSATDTASTAAAPSGTSSPEGPATVASPGTLSDQPTVVRPDVFRARLVETIVRLTRDRDLSPSQLRVGVATLGPVIDAGGTDAAREFVDVVGNVTTDVAGMAHFHVPVAMENDVVRALEPAADACVELRQSADGGLLHRWHLSALDGPSAWLELDG